MTSIVKKVIRGKPYYYARQCKRVGGKPKIVWQKYLGRPDDILAAMSGDANPKPTTALVREFGAVAALHGLAQRLRLAEHIDRHVPKRGPGPSVGTYLSVAALNRCVAPCSKASIAKWFGNTVLTRLLDIEARQLGSQRFWDNMHRVSPQAIRAIERDLVADLVREFDVDPRRVLFDATNFFTFIDTFNARSTLAQRGHSKEGRKALRIVGVALLVAADGHLPLLHRTYPGNTPDAPTFAGLTGALAARYRDIRRDAERITLVFDKGNNSKDNLQAVAESPYHFIGSLAPARYPDLLATPADKLRPLDGDGLPGVRAHRTVRTVFGAQCTVLVTHNENLFDAQSQTLLREIAKRRQRLRELQQRLRGWRSGRVRGPRPPTAESVEKKVSAWLKARHMKDLFKVGIEDRDGLPRLQYRFDRRAWLRLQKTLLGKTLIFTDNADWSDAEIVRGYRAQHHVENAFRDMKNPHHIALRPQHHWTDQKIEVHVFCCVLALLLCSLLQREMRRRGLPYSISGLLEQLGGIREVGVVYPASGKRRNPTVHMTVSQMTDDQRALYDALDLKRYSAA